MKSRISNDFSLFLEMVSLVMVEFPWRDSALIKKVNTAPIINGEQNVFGLWVVLTKNTLNSSPVTEETLLEEESKLPDDRDGRDPDGKNIPTEMFPFIYLEINGH